MDTNSQDCVLPTHGFIHIIQTTVEVV